MHSPRCRMLRSRERRAAETPPTPTTPPPSKFSWSLSLPHMNIPPPLHEWDSCWSTCLGSRQREMKHEVLEGSAVQTPSSRLRCNLFKAETFLFAGAAAIPLNQTGRLESLRPHESISLWWATQPFIFWNMRENKGLFRSCYLPLIWVMTHTRRYRATARRDNRGAAAELMLTLYLMKIPFICCGFWAAVTVPGRRHVGILLALCRKWKFPDSCSQCDDSKLCVPWDVRCLDSITKGTSWPMFTGEIAEITKLAWWDSSDPPTFDSSLSSFLIT